MSPTRRQPTRMLVTDPAYARYEPSRGAHHYVRQKKWNIHTPHKSL